VKYHIEKSPKDERSDEDADFDLKLYNGAHVGILFDGRQVCQDIVDVLNDSKQREQDLVHAVLTLVGQIVEGHHGVMRYQALMALDAVAKTGMYPTDVERLTKKVNA
jgi:hypothetical protein